MDGNLLLLTMITVSCVATIIRGLGYPFRRVRGQLAVTASILAAMGVLFVVSRGSAGYVGAGLWTALILTPLVVARWTRSLSTQRRYARARTIARVMQRLFPWDHWTDLPELFDALELARTGRSEEARAAFRRLDERRSPLTANARNEMARLTGEWASFVAWAQSISDREMRGMPEVIPGYLRALGEVGDIDGLLATYARFQASLLRPGHQLHLRYAHMMVLIYTGRVGTLERLLRTGLREIPPIARRYWLARARIAAGLPSGLQDLAELRDEPTTDADLRASAGRLLAALPPAFAPDARQRGVLERIELEIDQAARYGGADATAPRPIVTMTIIGANVAAFLLEVYRGGSTDDVVLGRMGALIPELIDQGEWWRLGASMFLHLGAWHLIMNMVALLVLGPFLERSIGHVRFAVVYLGAGLLAMGSIYRFEQDVAVGASGAVMAVVGGTAAAMLNAWLRERAILARARLRMMIALIGLQVIFDQVVNATGFLAGDGPPVKVSGVGHYAGAIFGFVVTWMLLATQRRSAPARPATT